MALDFNSEHLVSINFSRWNSFHNKCNRMPRLFIIAFWMEENVRISSHFIYAIFLNIHFPNRHFSKCSIIFPFNFFVLILSCLIYFFQSRNQLVCVTYFMSQFRKFYLKFIFEIKNTITVGYLYFLLNLQLVNFHFPKLW